MRKKMESELPSTKTFAETIFHNVDTLKENELPYIAIKLLCVICRELDCIAYRLRK